MSGSIKAEKVNDSVHVEEAVNEKKSKLRDYAGAVGKLDKVEITLVRKLDRRIMPALFALYFLLVHPSSPLSQSLFYLKINQIQLTLETNLIRMRLPMPS